MTEEAVVDVSVRYPHIHVKLIGQSGNPISIVGKVRRALARASLDPEVVNEFSTEALAGDYDHVLQTCMKWVTIQ